MQRVLSIEFGGTRLIHNYDMDQGIPEKKFSLLTQISMEKRNELVLLQLFNPRKFLKKLRSWTGRLKQVGKFVNPRENQNDELIMKKTKRLSDLVNKKKINKKLKVYIERDLREKYLAEHILFAKELEYRFVQKYGYRANLKNLNLEEKLGHFWIEKDRDESLDGIEPAFPENEKKNSEKSSPKLFVQNF